MKVVITHTRQRPLKKNSKSMLLENIPWKFEVYGINKVIAYGYAHTKEQAIGSGLNLAEDMRDSKGYYKNSEIDVVVK